MPSNLSPRWGFDLVWLGVSIHLPRRWRLHKLVRFLSPSLIASLIEVHTFLEMVGGPTLHVYKVELKAGIKKPCGLTVRRAGLFPFDTEF